MQRWWFALVGSVVVVALSACDPAPTTPSPPLFESSSLSPPPPAASENAPPFGAKPRPTPTPTPTIEVSSGPVPPATSTPVPGLSHFSVRSVSFIDPRNGWALVEPTPLNESNMLELRRTFNGGKTWSALPTPPGGGPPRDPTVDAPSPPRTLRFVTTDTGYLAGPHLYITRDGGRSWSRQSPDHIIQIEVTDQRVYALSEPFDGVHLVFSAAIGTERWSSWHVPGTEYAVRLSAARDTALVLAPGDHLIGEVPAHAGELWVSRDPSPGWVLHASPCRPADSGAQLAAVAFRRPAGWLVDCYSNEQSQGSVHTLHHLYVTGDAGTRWVRTGDPVTVGQPILADSNGIGDMLFIAAGGAPDGVLRRSDNSGVSWRTVLRPGTDSSGWADLRFVTTTTAFVVAPTQAGNKLYRTDDTGAHWRALPVNR